MRLAPNPERLAQRRAKWGSLHENPTCHSRVKTYCEVDYPYFPKWAKKEVMFVVVEVLAEVVLGMALWVVAESVVAVGVWCLGEEGALEAEADIVDEGEVPLLALYWPKNSWAINWMHICWKTKGYLDAQLHAYMAQADSETNDWSLSALLWEKFLIKWPRLK